MSFEKHLDRDCDSNEDHDDEMNDGITNMDITIIEDGDEPINYNGLEEEFNSDFNVAATLTSKKNLFETFEKHAGQEKQIGVKAKIQAFEKVNHEKKSSRNVGKNTVRFDAPASRPPPVPVTKASDKTEESLLSVYLRVRPLTVSKEALHQDGQDAIQNTIEILPSAQSSVDTMIRTYPPVQSNTSKAVRGQNHFVSNSSSSGSDSKAVECAVKGVKEFEFNEVFGPTSSQEDLYNSVAVPLIDGLFPRPGVKVIGDKVVGQSALLFSYGITNAGKTFTIMGNGTNQKSREQRNVSLNKDHGIIPRTMDQMLSKIEKLNDGCNDVQYSLNVSFLEIYNEDIYDLLPKENPAVSSKYGKNMGHFNFGHKLQLRDVRNGKIHVKGLSKHRITSLAQGLQLARNAKEKRHTSSNNINADSSRSHSICQFELRASPINVQDKNIDDNASVATATSGYGTDEESVVSGGQTKPCAVRFWVVDLAGSERSKRTGAFTRSTRQKEASLINSSLMNLMTCLRTLKNNQSLSSARSKVPFRDSKLTHLFMGHLTGLSASRTSMIVNVNPSVADFDETQHVLSYGVVARSVRIDRTEYDKKRQEIQVAHASFIPTHGHDGRALKSRSKSPPRKMAKIVKKLSPRAALKRRREKQAMAEKKKTELKHTRGTKKVDNLTEKPKLRLAGSKRKLEDQVRELREELDAERMKAARFKKETLRLKDQLENCEGEIRQELAEETAAQIQYTREQHEEIVKRLKQQLQSVAQTPSKSAKKVRVDRANQMIEELMDKVEEGEEEMERMRTEHLEETKKLKVGHEAEIAAMKRRNAEEIANREEQIERLQSELENGNSSLAGSSAYGSDLSFEEDEKENIENGETAKIDASPLTPGLKRLPRGRCSEVACANISPPKEQSLSSTKKVRNKRLRSKQSPFKVLSGSKAKRSRGSNVEDIIFPSIQPECDEDGNYRRPKGRAPQGRKWDPQRGGWKLSILS